MDENIFDFKSAVVNVNEVPLPFLTNEGFMKELQNMELRKDDIFIVTYPKSGTHWMQEIVQLILFEGQSDKLNLRHRRGVLELADVNSTSPEVIKAAGPLLRQVTEDPSPRVLTSHVPYSLLPKQFHEKSCKLMYVYRNPKDVIVSYYNFFSRRFGLDNLEKVHPSTDFSKFFDLTVSGKFQYGSWFDHVSGYYEHKGDENVFSVSFETMKKNLRKVVADLAQFIGKQLDEAAVTRVVEGASFQSMKAAYVKDHLENVQFDKKVFDASLFHHKGTTGQWREHFTPEQNKRFDEQFGEAMKNCVWTKPYLLDTVV